MWATRAQNNATNIGKMRRTWQSYEPEYRGIASSITENELFCMSELLQRRRERSNTGEKSVTKYRNAKEIYRTTWQQAWKDKSRNRLMPLGLVIQSNQIQFRPLPSEGSHVMCFQFIAVTAPAIAPCFFEFFLSKFKNMCLCDWWQTQRNNCGNQLLDWHFGNCISIKIYWFFF